ncbi:MAG: sugar ABC transporter substrate-binding protein [Deltaproteobacteria bacterium]|nr:sugar ABC transporter substrate-binding protein [Deltaproteobacteria bacterium]
MSSARGLGCGALLIGLGLTACGGGESSAPRAPGGAAERVEFWAMGSEGEEVEALLPGFRARNPGIEVRVQRVPWSAAHEKLLTAYVGRTMPDVFQIGNTWVPELVALGAVERLDTLMAGSPAMARDDYFAGVLATNVIGGSLAAVPWYVDTRLLFYRRDLLEEAGITEPPATWQSWFEACKRVREHAARSGKDRYGVFLPLDEWQTPVILALQRGAGLLRDNDSYGDFRSGPMREAVQFYLELFRQGLAPRKAAAQLANLYQEFASGYFAFYVTGPWNLREFAERLPADFRGAWATAPMPEVDGGGPGPGLSVAGGASLAIAASSPRKAAAWKLIEYLSEPAQQVEFYRLSGDLPVRRSAWSSEVLAGDEKTRAFREQLERLRATPQIPEWERIAAKIVYHMERMVRGERDIDGALADLDADVDAILEKRRWMLARGAGAAVPTPPPPLPAAAAPPPPLPAAATPPPPPPLPAAAAPPPPLRAAATTPPPLPALAIEAR